MSDADSQWSDDEVKKEMLDALQKGHPEDEAPKDPFTMDALGHTPKEEDSMGHDDAGGS